MDDWMWSSWLDKFINYKVHYKKRWTRDNLKLNSGKTVHLAQKSSWATHISMNSIAFWWQRVEFQKAKNDLGIDETICMTFVWNMSAWKHTVIYNKFDSGSGIHQQQAWLLQQSLGWIQQIRDEQNTIHCVYVELCSPDHREKKVWPNMGKHLRQSLLASSLAEDPVQDIEKKRTENNNNNLLFIHTLLNLNLKGAASLRIFSTPIPRHDLIHTLLGAKSL